MRIHYDNGRGFRQPRLHGWYPGSSGVEEIRPFGADAYGPIFELSPGGPGFGFTFRDGLGRDGPWEGPGFDRYPDAAGAADEIWCAAANAFCYAVEPRRPETEPASHFLSRLEPKAGVYLAETGGRSGQGATLLADGRVLFGLYHPTAARVYLVGSFNGWQSPLQERPDPRRFVELRRYYDAGGTPSLWLTTDEQARPGDEYKLLVFGGVPRDEQGRAVRHVLDPYARALGPDPWRNGVILDPTTYRWSDRGWQTPRVADLVLYELSVYGFTEGDRDIDPARRGRFSGVTERIRAGYFGTLGANALSLMPLAEVPAAQGPHSLGYDPSLYFTVERDFGSPDALRELVDAAHGERLAVVVDQVFNHTDNDFNPLWKLALDHPAEEGDLHEGGLYFSGTTPWGNRIDSGRPAVQRMLIDACRMLVVEFHVDGFRFDATHSWYMDHGLLHRLADELRRVKPDVILVAENLPNEPDLNRGGAGGYAQWCNQFHDKLKALLREGPFDNSQWPDTTNLGDTFYFSKASFAEHTDNVVNYAESHDETSIAYEVGTNPVLNNPAAKERKGRLGLFATLVALGQPMLYMGGEFNVERDRNVVQFAWPADLDGHGYFQWARRLIHLRRRYPGLRMGGDPAADGRFTWILGPWLDVRQGGGRTIVGWRARPSQQPYDTLVVMLNFEPFAVEIDVPFGRPGVWLKLADIDRVNDIPPEGSNAPRDPTAIRTTDGRVGGFVLPSSSGFIYKWEGPP